MESKKEAVEDIITCATSKGWLPNDEISFQKMSGDVSEPLHRQGKVLLFINETLNHKGLPEVIVDPALELDKAQRLLETKFSKSELEEDAVKAKAWRFLAGRGFQPETIEQLIKGHNNGE